MSQLMLHVSVNSKKGPANDTYQNNYDTGMAGDAR